MTLPEIDNVLQQAQAWVRLLASGDATAADIDALTEWLAEKPDHARAFERERGFWQDLEPHRALFASQAHTRRRAGQRRWMRKSSRRVLAGAIAASIMLAVTGPNILIRLQADHIAGPGEVRTVTLPDHSTAMLDASAAIAVHYDGGERRITLLRGRAWFDVAHGDARPFRVAADDGMVEDVGTAFEVAAGRSTEIAVSQGMVRVAAAPEATPLMLHAGERAYYHSGIASRLVSVAPDRIAAWRTGELLIDDMPLAEAVSLTSRYRRGLTLVWADLSNKPRVSGVFRIVQADDALVALATNAGVRITRLPTGAMILH